MPRYLCQFQHPQTGHGCEATCADGQVTFKVDSVEEFLAEGWSGDVDALKKAVEQIQALIEQAVGAGPVKVETLDEAQNVVHSVAREQFDYGLEEV